MRRTRAVDADGSRHRPSGRRSRPRRRPPGRDAAGVAAGILQQRHRRRRTPVTIWVVRRGDDLYVRSVNGRTGVWFRGTEVRHEGRIWAGGVEKDVTFVDADPGLNDQIDAAYRAKYRRYAANIISSIVSPKARSSTIKLVPRSANS